MTTYKNDQEMMVDVNKIAFFIWRDTLNGKDSDYDEYHARKKAAGVSDEEEYAHDRERQPEIFEW